MSRRRLLVLDAYDVDILHGAIVGGGAWDVLLLGLSEGWFRWLTPALPAPSPNLRFVDPLPLAAAAHMQVRAFVLDAIGGLPDLPIEGRPLREILRRDLHTDWWHTETSEKGPYRTPLVFQLYQLAMIDRAISNNQYEEVVVASPNSWLRRLASVGRATGPNMRPAQAGRPAAEPVSPACRYWRHALAAVTSAITVRLAGAAASWPRVVPSVGGECIFSFYPAWWTDAAGPDASERFFSSPPPETVFLCWLHAPAWVWRFRRAIADAIAARRIVVLQRFVSWRSVFRTLSPIRFARTLGLLRRLRNMPSISFAGLDVSPLIAADLERSLTGGERFQAPLLEDAVRRAAGRFGAQWVLYRAEFQPAERALVTGLRGVAPAAGFVHYMFGRHYLPIWEGSEPQLRSARAADTARNQPLPDAMLTCGTVGRAHLIESGYPADRIALCGPQRHAALVHRVAAPRDRVALRRAFGVAHATPLLLVTPAIIEADTEALFAALMQALEGFGPCRVAVRTHPNRPQGDAALARAVAHLGPERAAVLSHDVPLYDAIEASDALITIGSTVAFEAMVLGCMPIVFENPSTYAATSLAAFVDALYVVHDGRGLRLALDAVRTGSPDALRRRDQWADTVQRTLGDLETPLSQQLVRALAALNDEQRSRHSPRPLSTGSGGA